MVPDGLWCYLPLSDSLGSHGMAWLLRDDCVRDVVSKVPSSVCGTYPYIMCLTFENGV